MSLTELYNPECDSPYEYKPNSHLKDLTGQTFGELSVVCRAKNMGKHSAWKCKCSCGNIVRISSSHLLSGHTRSCGHLVVRHRETGTRLYRIWRGMKTRCSLKEDKHYADYGGRGISVCQEWQQSYELFRDWALENGYRDDLSIDRINNDGNYCPENCRWATLSQQSRNRRSNVYYELHGRRLTVSDWAEQSGIKAKTIRERLRRGWELEKAIFEPVKKLEGVNDG